MSRSFHPIQRIESLHMQVYQALRTAILAGEIEAGVRLVETQLAERLQVSRTPIREAIRQLQRENLIIADENGGVRVAMLSVDDAAQLYDCRIALEQLSIAEACTHATSTQLALVEQAIQQAERAVNQHSHLLTPYQLLHLDYQFHRLLAESSGNGWLVQILDQVFDKMAMLRLRTMQHNPAVLEVCSEHWHIFAALRDRDPIAATQAMRHHLISSKQRVTQEIKQLEPCSADSG